jgi:protein-histidine pros-kinase
MKLSLKFNLIFLAVFGLGLLATGFIANRFLQDNAREETVQEARLMMESAGATRNYTSTSIRPILERYQRQNQVFYPETVPAFSAIKVFSFLRKNYPNYSYREATLNPTNPEDRAGDWETGVINIFRNDPTRLEFVGERDDAAGPTLILATPLRAVQSCLECHSTADVAPAAMVKIYGSNNGFGWKLNEVVSARIVSVPMSVPQAVARKALWTLMFWLTAVSVVSLILLNLTLVLAVIRPVARLSAAADQISKGHLDVPELPVNGKDEVAVLADSFNRMHRSLKSAMKMLED